MINKTLFFSSVIFILVLVSCKKDVKLRNDFDKDSVLEQPAEVPGTIDLSIEQNYPPINEIVSKEVPAFPVYGLYGWCSYFGDWWHMHTHCNDVGWKVVRVGGIRNMTEEQMINLMDSGYEVLFTLTSGCWDADSIYVEGDIDQTDDNFINAFLQETDEMLNKYGPGGSFWTSYGSDQSSRIYWEIWNEPNQHYLYGKSENWNTKTQTEKARVYAKLLVAAYDHIKENWPEAVVVGFSACGVSRNDIWAKESPGYAGFIQMVHENVADMYGMEKAGNFYDILSNHPYVHNAPPDAQDIPSEWYNYSVANSYDIYRGIMETYGNADKPVWFTEVGWHRDEGVFSADSKAAVSERIQAAYVCRMYLTALRLGVERVHIMFVFDADNFNGGFFNYFDSSEPDNITWNESAYAVQNLINIMPRPKLQSAVSDGTDGYYAYVYNPDYLSAGDDVIVAWNVEGPLIVTIPCTTGKYRVVDMLGGEQIVDAGNEGIDVEIGPCPIYIIPSDNR